MPPFLQTTTPTADESAVLLADKIRRREHFSFFRFGDGLLELLTGRRGQTADHEQYSAELARDMQGCLRILLDKPDDLYLGDWMTASFSSPADREKWRPQWNALAHAWHPAGWLHCEALLLMRETQALANFYRAVQDDTRRKLYMGPKGNAAAAKWLDAEFLEVPMSNLYRHTLALANILNGRDFDVLLFGAGMAGNISVAMARANILKPERTFISIGSALDPLFRGRSRQQQLSRDRAWALFGDEPK